MLTKLHSLGINGLHAYPVTIEVDVTKGLPATVIIGLPDNAVKESKERIRSAIKNSGFKFNAHRITINLSPADVKKEGPGYDLAIALGVLVSTEQLKRDYLNSFFIIGELSLDGDINPVNGILPMALALSKSNVKGLIIPEENAKEASIVKNINIYPVKTLKEAACLISQPNNAKPIRTNNDYHAPEAGSYDIDFCDIKGQLHAKRGLEIAAAGFHNCLLVGPPGSGKSMLAKGLPSIIPDMNFDEAIETTAIHSITGTKKEKGLVSIRPFRSPHHTTSAVAIIGGGSTPKPGEVSLSHNGVLFMDELPEFSRSVLESLRQPLEDRKVTIARANQTIEYPSSFMFIAAMNPCPCGWFTDPKKTCRCSAHQVEQYLARVSGPLLDRIDIHLDVPSLDSYELIHGNEKNIEHSKDIKTRTKKARDIQQERLNKTPIRTNGEMSPKMIKEFCRLDECSKKLISHAIRELGLSARAYNKVLKIARTIADLDNSESIKENHLAEAVQYRNLDRKRL